MVGVGGKGVWAAEAVRDVEVEGEGSSGEAVARNMW